MINELWDVPDPIKIERKPRKTKKRVKKVSHVPFEIADENVTIKYETPKEKIAAAVKALDMTSKWWAFKTEVESHLFRGPQTPEAHDALVILDELAFEVELVDGSTGTHEIIIYDTEPIGEFGDCQFYNMGRVKNPYIFDYYGWAHMFQYQNVLKWCRKHRPIVLDIGSGDAQVGQFLYRNRIDPRYIGMDVSNREIKQALNQGWGSKLPLFLQRDIRRRLPFPDHTIDMVIMMESIEHVKKSEGIALLKESARVMADDGMALVATPNITQVRNKENWQEGGHLYEWDYFKLREEIEKYFHIERAYGTMIPRIADLKKLYKEVEGNWLFKSITEYFPSSFARLICGLDHPELAEDVTFIMKKKRS